MSDSCQDPSTRVCVLTPKGRGAIGVVAVRGLQATVLVANHFRAANGRPLGEQALKRIVYGKWDGGLGEDLIVCRRGPDDVEIHCHGGAQSSARIVNSLVHAGAHEVDWRQWIELRGSSLETEAQLALAFAPTLRTARILLDQYHGALGRELNAIQSLLTTDSHRAEIRLETLLGRAELGLHLTTPWQVVIAGRPNVGKSTLINALAGFERVITFDQPGTTRDVVSVVTAFAGWPVELSDTAGLHATDDELERAGIKLAREQIARADLLLCLLDATDAQVARATDLANLARVQAEASEVVCVPARTLVVVNKCDLAAPNPRWESELPPISAATGMGIAELASTIAHRLVPAVPPDGEAVPFTARQVDSLREALQRCRSSHFTTAAEHVREILVPERH